MTSTLKRIGKKTMIKKISILLFAIYLSSTAFADSVRFEAIASSTTVAVGQRFQVTFSLNTKGENFIAPVFHKFRQLSGPNLSNSMQYVNGQMSQSMSYSFILVANEEGTFTIGGASILVDGKNYKSNSLEIKVVKAGQATPITPNRNQNNQNQNEIDLKDYVFVKTFVDKSSAFIGEKLTVTFKLYSRLTLTNLTLEKLPVLNGFWTQDVRTIYDKIELSREQVNGVVYQVAELQKSVLYPQRSGDLIIDPMEIKVGVQTQSQRRQSIFDQIFGSYESKEVIVGSNALKIKVEALPTAGKPANFSGAVGNFTIDLVANKDSIKANEAIDVTLTIKGNGNFPLLSAPKLNFPADFETYDPDVSNNFKTTAAGSAGSKVFKYLVIPRHSGKFTIEPFQFGFFDLATKRYKVIKSDSLQFIVSKGTESEGTVYRGSRKSEIEILNDDIRYIHQDTSIFLLASEGFYGSTVFYTLIFLLILLFAVSYFIIKKIKAKNSNLSQVRQSNAVKVAKKRMAKAKTYLSNQENSKFYEEISTALYGYFSDKFGISVAELSQEKILDFLAKIPESGAVQVEVKSVLEEAEMARFASTSSTEPNALYNKSIEIIRTIENLNR